MALWDRKIHWQFGGNVQPVRMICEVDWKSCPFTILNYLWSEIVTDVIDYVTVTDGVLWRVITPVCCMLLVLYTFWSKITEIIENIMKEQIFNGINFKLKNLEMRVNVLAYRMQYGSWPLPDDINGNSEIIKTEDNQAVDLFAPDSHNSWYSKIIPECILKRNNLKFQLNESNTFDENCITQKAHSKRKACKKCVKGIQSNKHINIKCQTPQIRKSTGIQCQTSDELNSDEGYVEIPLKLLSNSPDVAKLFTSTKITLGKVRQRLESLHTVLKIYRNEQGMNLTREKTAREVNLLDSFLQELSDLQSGAAESDDPPVKNIPEDFVHTPQLSENKSIQMAGQVQGNDQFSQIPTLPLPTNPTNEPNQAAIIETDNSHELGNFPETIPSGDNETTMDSADSLVPAVKNSYASQPLDSIIEEQSGNSCNEQLTDCDDCHENQKAKLNANDTYVNAHRDFEEVVEVDDTQDPEPTHQGAVTIPCTTLEQATPTITAGESQQLMLNIHDNEINDTHYFGDTNDGEGSKKVPSEIIIFPSIRTKENITNDSIIESDNCCSAFMKLENIKFTALTEIENSWTNELFVDEHLQYIEPLVLKNSFTGFNFTINVLSDKFRERIARLKDIIDPTGLDYPEKKSDGIKNAHESKLQLVALTKIAHEGNLSLSSTSTDSSIEKPKRNEGPFQKGNNLNLSCIKRNVNKNNFSKSSIELSSRRSKSYGTTRTYETSSKRSNTPQISPDSIHQKCKIKEQIRSSSLDCIRRENHLKSRSKSGIPVLKSRLNDRSTKKSRDHCSNPRRTPPAISQKSQISTDKDSNRTSTCLSKNEDILDHNSEEQTIIYINIINEPHQNPMKMENSQEFSDYIKENIFKIRGLTEYIKNSGVSKIVTIVCSSASQNTDDQSKDSEVVPQRKFIIDTNTLV